MKFIVHVIDEISNHRKSGDKYELIETEDENGDKGHVFRTDAFYYVEEEAAIDAVVSVIKIIKIINSDKESKSLASVLRDLNKEPENNPTEGEKISEIFMSYTSYDYNNKTDSELFFATCQFEREDEDDKWIEFHRFSIYTLEEKKAVKISKNEKI